jgi:4-diphosphocytidyl-2-C-methyl-D-erythritol kinase
VSRAVRVEAPAKVNLWLRVLRRREDGFHEIDTLFQAIDLCDEIRVELGGDGVSLTVEGPPPGPEEDNLAYRAVVAFRRASALADGVRVHLTKRIPAGAGLGGGSSDAAAVLRALDRLTEHPLTSEALCRIAAELGSDVPFFLGESPLARGWGRGERLTPWPPLPSSWLLLACPSVHVATGPAYEALKRTAEPIVVSPAPDAPRKEWEEVARWAGNDFEPVVAGSYPEVAAALDALAGVGPAVRLLSGSGAACFALYDGVEDVSTVAARLTRVSGIDIVAARTLTAFPAVRPA